MAAAAHLVTAPMIAAISGGSAWSRSRPTCSPNRSVGADDGARLRSPRCSRPVAAAAARLLAWLAGWPCRWLVAVADFFGGLHGATLPWPGGVAGGLALLLVTVRVAAAAVARRARRVLAAAAVTAVAGADPGARRHSGLAAARLGDRRLRRRAGRRAGAATPAAHAAVEIDAGPDPVPSTAACATWASPRVAAARADALPPRSRGRPGRACYAGAASVAVLAGPLADPGERRGESCRA